MIAITLERPAGTALCPQVLSPQATTVPSPSSARLWWLPAPIATTLVTVAGGAGTTPQETTLPLFLRAMMLSNEAAIATALVNPAGTVDWLPQTTTVPLVCSATLNPLPAAIATEFDKLEGDLASP